MKHKRSLISVAMAALMLISMVVVASVGVNAADGSSAKVQTSGALVGAPVQSAPAVCNAQDVFREYLFVKGTNGDLLWKSWDVLQNFGWSPWKSLGGYMTSNPAAVYRSGGRINVFVRGDHGGLWSTYTTDYGANWHPWYEVGGKLLEGTGPAAYAFPDGRLGWMVTGDSHTVWHAWIDAAGGYHDYSPLTGGYLTSSPAVTSPAQDRLDVFGRGDHGGLWWISYNNGWSNWMSIPDKQIALGSSPAACSRGPGGGFDVFITGTDLALWHVFMPDQWGARYSWEPLGGDLTSSPTAAFTGNSNFGIIGMIVYARGSNGNIWGIGYYEGWNGWGDIGGI